jgi:hypothetical protein
MLVSGHKVLHSDLVGKMSQKGLQFLSVSETFLPTVKVHTLNYPFGV